MDAPVIKIAGPGDARAVAALRRAWTEEDDGPAGDAGFETRFVHWYTAESGHRVTWLAETDGQAVGMVNLVEFSRMPRPGREPSTWGYLSNAFVLAGYRDRGTGSALLRAVLAHADAQGYVRVVLRPSQRAVPLYQRYGFSFENDVMVRGDGARP
jgi:GNAT superfamily N-acetyltransferase